MKKAMMFLAMMVAGMAVSAPVKSNVAGDEVGRNGVPLPYEAEVEYLQGDGGAYINTGIIGERGFVITCKIGMAKSYGSSYGYFGSTYGTDELLGGGYNLASPFADRRFSFRIANNLYWCITKNKTNVYQDGNLHEMVIDTTLTPPIVSFDNTSVGYQWGHSSGQASIPNLPLYIFAVNSAGIPKIAPSSVAEKIGDFKIEKNSVLVLDFIPVRVGTVGYMYDRVTGILFGNAGTGAFVIGPDKE